MWRKVTGISLLECLLIMVIIGALALWLNGPYVQFIEQQSVEAQLARIATAMIRMRSEAITRNSSVQVCLANLKSNLDIQGCQAARADAQGFPVTEGLLFFIDQAGGQTGVYNSKEGREVLLLSPHLTVYSDVATYRIRPSGTLSVTRVNYTVRGSTGTCRQLQIGVSGFRRVMPCD